MTAVGAHRRNTQMEPSDHVGVRAHPDTWSYLHLIAIDRRALMQAYGPGAAQIEPVVGGVDVQSGSQAPRTPEQAGIATRPWTTSADVRMAVEHLSATKQHGCPLSNRADSDVQAPVHAVGSVDVRRACAREHRRVGPGAAAGAVAGGIMLVVRLGLHDACRNHAAVGVLPDHDHAQQSDRCGDGLPLELVPIEQGSRLPRRAAGRWGIAPVICAHWPSPAHPACTCATQDKNRSVGQVLAIFSAHTPARRACATP